MLIFCHIFYECVTNLYYDFITYSLADTRTMTQLCLYLPFHWRLNRVFFTNIPAICTFEQTFSTRKLFSHAFTRSLWDRKPLRKWLVVHSQRLATLLQEMDTNNAPSSGRDIFLFSKSHVPLVADLISLRRIYEYTSFKRIFRLCFVPSENDFLDKVNAFMFSDVETHIRGLCIAHSLTTGSWRKVKTEQRKLVRSLDFLK